jgi:hypothetical protein
MGYTYYQCFGLISPKSYINLESLKSKIDAEYSRSTVPGETILKGQKLHVKIEHYQFYIVLATGSHVLEESVEMAAYAKDDPEKMADIQLCTKRFEMYGDPDPNMDFFNDFLLMQECMQAMGPVHIFDPQSGTFLDLP